MKKTILSVVGCLLLGAATTMASNELVIHLASGTTQRYVLLNEEPSISFSGDNIVVKTNSAEVSYAMEDVKFFNYENTTTAIRGVENGNGMKITGDLIVFSGLPAGSKISIHGMGGQLYLTETADAEGNASVNISSLSTGVYIVNANNISTKITKK